MALNQSQAPSSGIWNAIKGALGIFEGINKAEGYDENANPQPEDEFESKMSDAQIIELTSNWKRIYNTYYSDIEGSQTLAFGYWIGKQDSDEAEQVQGNRPMVDNLIFEAVETFIPIATRANPDPMVTADPSDLGQQMAHDLKEAIVREADRMKLRKVLKKMLRLWIIYKLGVIELTYNNQLERIEIESINPKLMIFDRDGWIDEAGLFRGEYLGRKKKNTAEKLIELFPKKKEIIMEKAKGKLGTKIEYTSWWYHGTDNFYTMDENVVLGKFKNPHWNYDSPEGNIQGTNHLDEPTAPYVFLSIFSTGLQPHDETSLISQNIGLQDMVNRRYRQIDDNVRKMNNGLVVSSDFTLEQASQASAALARGIAIRAASKDVSTSVMRLPAPALPPQLFEMLNDGRQQIKNIFGTSGSSPQGLDNQDTVRGKILVNQLDTSRIGGGITEYLEQVAATVYNYWVQMMFVHWTDPHYFVASGAVGGANLISLKNTNFLLLKSLDITVKEGSLIPKDPLTQRNEAMDLWSANAIDPINLGKRLDMADPVHYAEQLIIWQMVQKGQLPPQAYIPNFMQDQQAQGMVPPPGMAPTVPGQPTTAQPNTPGPGGVGDTSVNALGPKEAPEIPPIGTQVGESAQSKQLLQSIPIPK